MRIQYYEATLSAVNYVMLYNVLAVYDSIGYCRSNTKHELYGKLCVKILKISIYSIIFFTSNNQIHQYNTRYSTINFTSLIIMQRTNHVKHSLSVKGVDVWNNFDNNFF
jgi:hypothetical protein